MVEDFEKIKDDDKLTPEENLSKRIKRMILWNYFLDYISTNINGRRGKRAYLIVCFFKCFSFFIISIIFFTFLNYQLFQISHTNFTYTVNPNLFDFFYYTFKTLTYSNIDSLKPLSVAAKVAETSSFVILSIYLITIFFSLVTSLKLSEYSSDVEDAVALCRVQNERIELHLKEKYNTDITKAINEVDIIKNSVLRLKSILERIL